MFRKIGLVVLPILLCLASISQAAQISVGQKGFRLNLKDQYDNSVVYPLTGDDLREDGKSPVVLLVVTDKDGKDGAEAWGKEMAKLFASQLGEEAKPGLKILPIAHLKGVPVVMRAMVKGFFVAPPDEPRKIATGLDWDGEVAGQFTVVAGQPNLFVLDSQGVFLYRMSAPMTAANKEKVLSVLRPLLK